METKVDVQFINNYFYNKIFYKVLSPTLCNRGFQYVLGFNKLIGEYIPSDYCNKGGLFFCELKNVIDWISLYDRALICEVLIPLGAQVYKSKYMNKYKTNCMIISNPLPISDFLKKHQSLYVNNISGFLRYIEDQTNEICLDAVKQNPFVLKFVKNQTDEICIAAVRKNGLALMFVKNQTYYICWIAVEKDIEAIQYVEIEFLKTIKEKMKLKK